MLTKHLRIKSIPNLGCVWCSSELKNYTLCSRVKTHGVHKYSRVADDFTQVVFKRFKKCVQKYLTKDSQQCLYLIFSVRSTVSLEVFNTDCVHMNYLTGLNWDKHLFLMSTFIEMINEQLVNKLMSLTLSNVLQHGLTTY